MPVRTHNARTGWLIKVLALDAPLQMANIGAWIINAGPAYKRLRDHDVAHLHGFEPEPVAYESLNSAAEKNMMIYPHAVGKPGPAKFFAHKIGSLSSVFQFCASAATYLGKKFWVQRPITKHRMTLVALVSAGALPRLDMLKMDVQWAEFDVLEGWLKTLENCVMVIPEVRFYGMYKDEPMWSDVDGELRKQGFVLHKFLHQKPVLLLSSKKSNFRKCAGSQLLDGDAVYIRNDENANPLSDRQLMALALAADVVVQSYDLCACCLDALKARDVLPENSTRKSVNRLSADVLVEQDDAARAGKNADV